MYFTAIATLLLLASSASFTNALPTTLDLDHSEPQSTNITERFLLPDTIICVHPVTYDLSMAPILMYEDPTLVTGITVGPDPAGAQISAGYTYSTTELFNGGVSGGVKSDISQADEVAGMLNMGGSLSRTKGAAVSGTVMCPANVTCGLTGATQYAHVEGTSTMHNCGWRPGPGQTTDPNAFPCIYAAPSWGCDVSGATPEVPAPFSASYPVKAGSSLVDGQDSTVTDFNACAVGQPDGGLPQCPRNTGNTLPPGMTCNLQACTTATCQAMCANQGVPNPSPTCQWSPTLGCSWCNCRAYFSNAGGGSSSS